MIIYIASLIVSEECYWNEYDYFFTKSYKQLLGTNVIPVNSKATSMKINKKFGIRHWYTWIHKSVQEYKHRTTGYTLGIF